MFEPGEASFDTIAVSIEFFIVGALLLAVGFGRHYRNGSHGLDMFEDGLAVVALVGQHPRGFSLAEQGDGLGAVVDLTAGDQEVHR